MCPNVSVRTYSFKKSTNIARGMVASKGTYGTLAAKMTYYTTKNTMLLVAITCRYGIR